MGKKVFNSMHYKGTAMPYIALFDSNGIPIKNPLTGIPLGAYIDNFSYRYDEEKENEFTLQVHVGNPDMVDAEVIADGATILLQWGYVYANGSSLPSVPKAMLIKNVDPTFDDSGTNLIIKGSDGTLNLRYLPPFTRDLAGDTEDTLSRYLDNGLENRVGIIIEKF